MKKTLTIIIAGTVGIIILGLLVIEFLLPKQKPPEPVQPLTPPTVRQQITPGLPTAPTLTLSTEDLQKITALLPIETDEFIVEYYPRSNTIFVTIKQAPYATNQDKAIIWLKERGVLEPTNTTNIHFIFGGNFKLQ